MVTRKPWREELEIIDRTMKAISGITDPEELVTVYWENIGDLISIGDYVSMSRRGVEAPYFLITRSTRFEQSFNPWTQRDQLPKLTGGFLGEIAYSDKPVLIDNLESRLLAEDPGYFYLQGFASLIALPQYDDGLGVNVTALLFKTGAELDRALIPMIHWQSGLFGRGTHNLVLKNQLASAVKLLDREMQAVGDIQKSLLPETLPNLPGFDLAAHYQTSARAGGDYYDFFQLDDGGWGIFIADVSGHGTPAAVLMAIAHAKPRTHTPPQALLQYLNDRLTSAYTRGGTFVTAFYAVLDPVQRTLSYSRAGHNPPRLVRGDRVISIDAEGGLPLGIVSGQSYQQASITLEPGDRLLLYTDGITEAMTPMQTGTPRDLFGLERLDRLLLDCKATSAQECIDRVKAAVTAFGATDMPCDDQTSIAIFCL